MKSANLPWDLTIKKVNVYNQPEIADVFNGFFCKYWSETGQSNTKHSLQTLNLPFSYLIFWKGLISRWFKHSKGTPVYKAGDSSDISNYRPISILPCFSNILERLMHNLLYRYLKENNILFCFWKTVWFSTVDIPPTMLPSN